jgi:hypothetical protein
MFASSHHPKQIPYMKGHHQGLHLLNGFTMADCMPFLASFQADRYDVIGNNAAPLIEYHMQ